MASTMHLQIVILILTTGCTSFIDAQYSQYVPLISDIRNRTQTTGVMLMCAQDTLDGDESATAHMLFQMFSEQGVFTLLSHFDHLNKCLSYYEGRIGRPIVVILIQSIEEIDEFNRGMGDMEKSFPVWLIIFHDRYGNSLCDYCLQPRGNKFDLRYDTSVVVVCCADPTLRVWWSADHNKTEILDIGKWTTSERLKLSEPLTLVNRRFKISGTGLRIIYVSNSPFVRARDGKIGSIAGDVLNELKKAMNFTIEKITPVHGFGIKNWTTNAWTGAMGVLERGEADLLLAISITRTRSGVVDFTYPILQSRTKLFIKKPDGTGMNWFAHFEVFERELWVIIIVFVITVPLILALIKLVLRESQSLVSSYFDNHVLVWGIFCQQAMFQFPENMSMRMAYYSIFASGIIVYAAYSASLISFITVSIGTLPFSDVQGFVDDGSYKLIMNQNSSYYEFFTESKLPIVKQMKALMKPTEQLPSNHDDAWKQVCSERTALVTSEAAKQLMEDACNVIGIDTGGTDSLAMALPRGSQYTAAINYHLQRFRANGLISRLQAKHYRNEDIVEANFNTVEFYGVAPVLCILGTAIIFSLIVWLSETIYHGIVNRKSRRLRRCELRRHGTTRRNGIRGREKISFGNSPISRSLRDVKLDPSFIGYYP